MRSHSGELDPAYVLRAHIASPPRNPERRSAYVPRLYLPGAVNVECRTRAAADCCGRPFSCSCAPLSQFASIAWSELGRDFADAVPRPEAEPSSAPPVVDGFRGVFQTSRPR